MANPIPINIKPVITPSVPNIQLEDCTDKNIKIITVKIPNPKKVILLSFIKKAVSVIDIIFFIFCRLYKLYYFFFTTTKK
jgi:hypothetical protein